MLVLTESETSRLITHELASAAVRRALSAAASPGAYVFPAVIAHGSERSNTFSVKSGATATLAGLKVGSFWPANPARGLPRHHSTIILMDQETGRIGAVIEAARANAFRTAAADAVAADLLARPDARILAVFGAGHQAEHECLALARVRSIEAVHVVGRDAARARRFAERLTEQGLAARPSAPEEACRAADIVVTATPSRAPLFEADWVRPGTHVASMGSDARGKQELPPALFGRAALFCDLPDQSMRIGEFQHVRERIERGELSLQAIGDVIEGRIQGRPSPEAVTVFDSSGISLQDLFLAEALLEAARGPRR